MIDDLEYCEVSSILYRCEPMDGVMGSPTISSSPTATATAPSLPASPTPSSSPSTNLTRTTEDGKTCMFPFYYRGQVFSDCTVIGQKEQCYIDNQWSVCIPLDGKGSASQTDVVRTTAIGICTFPNYYRGNVYNDCFTLSGSAYCEVNGILAECIDADQSAAVGTSPFTGVPSSSSPAPTPDVKERMTTKGEMCTFPFTYRGGVFYDCTSIAGNFSCLIDGRWQECMDFIAEDIEMTLQLKANSDSANDNNAGSENNGDGGGSGLAPGAVAGIVISVLFIVVLATLGVLYYLHLQRKPVQQFVKFDDPVVDGGEEVVANGGDQHLEETPVAAFKPVHVQPEPKTFV
eukprot:TRINITY_DN7545_c3_g1_i2.p1 TRINITY_DN7545_c3_g1~~TRINITY_DN7545_c3_g1_i2.p1  ORF type:complete len:392 (-),score=45.44 TRINITY_DN7545_c3_g1_i2:196-1233(-)